MNRATAADDNTPRTPVTPATPVWTFDPALLAGVTDDPFPSLETALSFTFASLPSFLSSIGFLSTPSVFVSSGVNWI